MSEAHKESLTEDILMQTGTQNLGMNVVHMSNIFHQGLIFLTDKVLEIHGKDLKEFGLCNP